MGYHYRLTGHTITRPVTGSWGSYRTVLYCFVLVSRVSCADLCLQILVRMSVMVAGISRYSRQISTSADIQLK